MIPSVQSKLTTIVGNVASLTHAKGAGRAYELYIMTGLALELHSRGCRVQVRRSDGSLVAPTDVNRQFIQRAGAPSGISGSSMGQFNASSILFKLASSKREWEIWNGIQFIGRSQAMHEVDISIIPCEVASTLRATTTGGRPIGRPNVAIECKDVGTPGHGDEMRSFVARLYDLTILKGHKNIAHIPSPLQSIYPGAPIGDSPFETFWDGNRSTFNVVARRTGFTRGALSLTKYYCIQPRGPICPGTSEYGALIYELTDWIMVNLV